jgi:hypothetical protein
MKIINRTQFLALPAGTVYCEFRPHHFDAFMVKGVKMGNDFEEIPLTDQMKLAEDEQWVDKILEVMDGAEAQMDFDSSSRNGFFDADALFAVWDMADIRGLIDKLSGCLESSAYKAPV